eukprot:TRINITY_DN7237_c0_g2_i2.p1 TRINITY_DN7237_c0_g2~~TRINITY_DN7237_c0_g2_i2.p1  ORF type:complete len:230 (+),score=54.47 TRINITY_DN7237_c0_g2_i2:87-692(+)
MKNQEEILSDDLITTMMMDIFLGLNYLHLWDLLPQNLTMDNFVISENFVLKVTAFGPVSSATLFPCSPESHFQIYTSDAKWAVWNAAVIISNIYNLCCSLVDDVPQVEEWLGDDEEKLLDTWKSNQEVPFSESKLDESLERRSVALRTAPKFLFQLVRDCLWVDPHLRPIFHQLVCRLRSIIQSNRYKEVRQNPIFGGGGW